MQKFSANATADQREALNTYIDAAEGAKDVHGYRSTPETECLAAAEVALEQTMTSDQWEDFRVRAKDFSRRIFSTDHLQEPAAHFDVHWGRRWICKRAHELGWTSELFGDFDNRSRSYGRNDHKIERIGKKYQWLALHELIARMGDKLTFLGSRWSENDEERPMYRGARDVGLRDIDPSFLTTQTHYDGWREWGRTWWVSFDPQFRAMGPHERIAWLHGDRDIINNRDLIDLRNPKTGRRWLALSGFSSWKGSGIRRGKKEFQRETWFRLTCIVVHREDQTKMVKSLRDKILTNPDSFPDIELDSHHYYLGEYHWHPEISEFDRWSSHDGWRAFAVPIRPTVASYVCEGVGHDNSIDKTIIVAIPARWLSKEMGLRLSSGRSLIYVNPDGHDTFYDTSVVESGPATALVDRDSFLRMLDRKDLSAIWVIAGEKSAYGGSDAASGFGGRLRHTAIYCLDGDGFARHFHKDHVDSTLGQLKKFFGDDPVPSGIETRPEVREA